MLPQAGDAAMATPQAAARHRLEQTRFGSTAAFPDQNGWTQFARAAEAAGIESVLISISRHEPDPMLIACALGCSTQRLKYIVAYRSGAMLPTTFVQQLNTLSSLLGGRVAFNMVAGSSRAEQHAYGDHVEHDERYARADEFLAICRALWCQRAMASDGAGIDFRGVHYEIENGFFPTPFVADSDGRIGPEIYVSGHSAQAERLAVTRATCWLRCAEPPEAIAPLVARTRERGVEVGLRMCVMCRPTRDEAVDVLESLVPVCRAGIWGEGNDARDDSKMYAEARSRPVWLGERLWTGLVPDCGPVWATLVGTPRELADALLDYGRVGVTQFILSSWPEISEVTRFGREVIPLVRAAEQGEQS
jgi:alkanesulfonate monooxygenase